MKRLICILSGHKYKHVWVEKCRTEGQYTAVQVIMWPLGTFDKCARCGVMRRNNEN